MGWQEAEPRDKRIFRSFWPTSLAFVIVNKWTCLKMDGKNQQMKLSSDLHGCHGTHIHFTHMHTGQPNLLGEFRSVGDPVWK